MKVKLHLRTSAPGPRQPQQLDFEPRCQETPPPRLQGFLAVFPTTTGSQIEMSTLKGAEALPMKSLRTVYTDLPPSCVLHAPQNPDLIVVGTYYLDESATVLEEKKTGSLLLYQQIPSSDGSGNNDLCVFAYLTSFPMS